MTSALFIMMVMMSAEMQTDSIGRASVISVYHKPLRTHHQRHTTQRVEGLRSTYYQKFPIQKLEDIERESITLRHFPHHLEKFNDVNIIKLSRVRREVIVNAFMILNTYPYSLKKHVRLRHKRLNSYLKICHFKICNMGRKRNGRYVRVINSMNSNK